MKTTFLTSMLALVALTSGCDAKNTGGVAKGSTATVEVKSGGEKTGVKECDEYIAKLKTCKGAPEAAKKAWDLAAEGYRKALAMPNVTDAQKKEAQEGCNKGLQALKETCK